MSKIIRSTDIKGALRSKQKGFLINPFRMAPPPAGEGSDPYYSNVVLLSHYEGADASTVFLDNSATPKTPTAVGGIALSTAQQKFGVSSLLTNGTSKYLSYAPQTAWDFGTGDFTMESWFRSTTTAGFQCIICRQEPSNNMVLQFRLYQAKLECIVRATGGGGLVSVTHPTAYTINVWNHAEVTRASGTIRLFLNGVMGTPTIGAANITPGSARPLTIGVLDDTILSGYFSGDLDEIRITKGIARHTANFSVPTAPYPNF